MSAFLSFIGLVCVCAAGVSILNILSPETLGAKTLPLVAGVFVVAAVIVPAVNLFKNSSLQFNLPETPEYSDSAQSSLESSVIKEAESELSEDFFKKLLSEGYAAKKVRVYLGYDESGGIIIEGVSIYIDESESRIAEIIKLCGDEFEVEPTVIEE